MSFILRGLFSRERESRNPSAALNVTQSMIDFISEDLDPNSSFRSHQISLDRSFSTFENDHRYKLERVDTDPEFAARRPRLTITSALNTPKKGTIVEYLYDMLHEQVIEQLGEMFQSKKEQIISPKLLKVVQQKDFDLYIARLRKVFEVYKKNNTARIKLKQKEQVNMAASLLRCYEIVPSQYFEENFLFNFGYLVKDKSVILKVQEDLADYLDLVEINLYHQVTSRFEEYLDVLLKINQMEVQIQSSLYSIKFFRNFNQEVRSKFSSKVEGVLRLKMRKINIDKTLALIDLINVVKKTLPTLVHLIQKNNFESAVKIVRTSEETYKTKLKQVKCLKNFHVNFNDARNTLEKLLTSAFEDRCINYFSSIFSYNKTTPNNKDNLFEESFMNIINMGESNSDQTNQISLYWTINNFQVDTNAEKNIAKIVVEYIKIKDFPLTVYKGKLLELMKKFHKKFITDINEYVENLTGSNNSKANSNNNSNNSNLQKALPFELHLKFILFYFEIFKRFIGEHFNLNIKILSTLIDYFNSNFVEKNNRNPVSFPFLQVLDQKVTKDLTETVQEFYLTLAMIFKYFNDRMTEIINLRNFENITIQQFTQLVSVFDKITDYFHNTLQIDEKLNSWIVSDKDGIKKPLIRLVSSLIDKITISPIQTLIIEIERGFISSFHKKQLDGLKTSLEQESWQPVDIPQEYLDYFEIFFKITSKKYAKATQSDMGSTESSSPSIESNGQIQDQEIDSQGKKEEFFKVDKNEFYLQGKKFQVTSSFLLLVQDIYEYIQIAFRFRFIELDSISKVFEMMKFYNSYTIQLILGAGATTFGKIPRITAKILGISSISLCLLIHLIGPLYENIMKQDCKINQEWLNLEVTKVKHDLNSHVNEIGAKIRSILKSKLVEQSTELKKINWASAQEKIVTPTKFLTNILTNTKQMYKQIQGYLLKEQLILIAKGILEDIRTCYLPVFESINVETGIAAKRVKDELQHLNEELYHIAIFQEPEVGYSDFEDKILSIIEDKCNHYLEITSIN